MTTEKVVEWLEEYITGADIKDNQILSRTVSEFRVYNIIIISLITIAILLYTLYRIFAYLGFLPSVLVCICILFSFPVINFIRWNRTQNKNQTQKKEQENGNQNL